VLKAVAAFARKIVEKTYKGVQNWIRKVGPMWKRMNGLTVPPI